MSKIIVDKSSVNAGENVHIGDSNYYSISSKELVFSKELMGNPLNHYLERRYAKKPNLSFWEYIREPAYSDLADELLDKGQIVLLGEAGLGKSTELKRICNQLRGEGQFRVAYYPLKNLGVGSHVPYLSLSESDAGNTDDLVVLLDGMDEVNFVEAKQRIESITQEYSNLKVIVTCRTNNYKSPFENFHAFFLQRLDGEAVDKYLREEIPASRVVFEERISTSGIKELIYIPFYLEKIIQFFKANDNTLPKGKNEIVEFFINETVGIRTGLKADQILDLKEKADVIQSLERLGFVMECMASNQMQLADLEKVFDEEEGTLSTLLKSSLIEVASESLQFTHRIFQEYLAAKALKRVISFKKLKEVVGVAPRFEKLKPSWLNSISLFWNMLEVEHPCREGLLHWMMTKNVEHIFKFERDKIDNEVREQVLKSVLRKIRSEELFNVIAPDLAPLIESNRSFLLLLDKLDRSNNQGEKQIILELLDYFDLQYVVEEKKPKFRTILWHNILQNKETSGDIKYTALHVLIRCFDDITSEEIDDIFKRFFDSEDVYERAIVYELIRKAEVQDKFMEKLLERVVYIEENFPSEKGDRLGREKLHIERCFEGIKSEKALIEYFKYYSSIIPEHFGPMEKSFFKEMLEKALEFKLSYEEYHSIFNNIQSKLVEELLLPRELSTQTIEKFLSIAGKRNDLLSFCLNSDRYSEPKIVSILLRMENMSIVIERYIQKAINDQWVNILIAFLGRLDKALMERFVEEINQTAGSSFISFIPPTEPDPEEKNEGIANEKKLLFSKKHFITAVKGVFEWFEKDCFEKNEIIFSDAFKDYDEQQLFYNKFPNFLLYFINDRYHLSQNELLARINKKWEWISAKEIYDWLKINNNPDLTEEEQLYLRNWCDNHLRKSYSSGEATIGNMVFYHFTFLFKFKGYPESVYLNAIGEGYSSHFGGKDVFDALLNEMQIPFEKIKEKVLDYLLNHFEDRTFLPKHLAFVEKSKIRESIPHLQKIIKFNQAEFIKIQALNAYLSCEGDEEFLYSLMEEIALGETSEDIIIRHGLQNRDSRLQEVLIRKLSDETTTTRNKLRYAEYLLYYSNLSALAFLASYARENRKSPFLLGTAHREVIPFENKQGMGYLLKLFVLGTEEAIDKDGLNEILIKVRQMIYYLAFSSDAKYYSYVEKKLRFWVGKNKVLLKLPPKVRNWFGVPLKDTVRSIEFFYNNLQFDFYQSQKFSLEEAIKLSRQVFLN
ncbi:MAG: hypothetical protein H6573_27545 [Lewinellaceae bacterium]|nr:hypothetical protein [Lewinellaceae bacterium]